MAYALGFAALFVGSCFIICGYKGGGTSAMNSNLIGMFKGTWPTSSGGGSSTTNSGGANALTGGTYGTGQGTVNPNLGNNIPEPTPGVSP